ncbi:hypothetical protein ACFX11_032221 [Malus domestica]
MQRLTREQILPSLNYGDFKICTNSIKGKFSESGKQPGPFALFLQEHGIDAQYTNPGTPEQNGVSERRNRTLIKMVRSMMNNSKLHTFLWGKAIKTTNYLLNRVPSKSIPKTPFELWTNRKPVLNHLGI